MEVKMLFPALIASVVGYSVFGAALGWMPTFAVPADVVFTSPPQLLYYVLLGVLCGLVGLLYARSFYGIVHIFDRFTFPRWLKPAIGGLLVGLIGLVLPQVIGMSDGWLQVVMTKDGLLALPLWIIILIPFGKIVATGLTVGSGGSGGIFGPGIAVGGLLGALFWRISYTVLPGIPATPAPFVIVGMVALFGGIAHAPLAMMIMVSEMTGNTSLLVPAMVAVSISSLLVGNSTIYISQPRIRADSPAHQTASPSSHLSTLTVRQVLRPLGLWLLLDRPLIEAVKILEHSTEDAILILDARKNLQGVLRRKALQEIPAEGYEKFAISNVMERDAFYVTPYDTLDDALQRLTSQQLTWAPIVDAEDHSVDKPVIGMFRVEHVISLYRESLALDERIVRKSLKMQERPLVMAKPKLVRENGGRMASLPSSKPGPYEL